MIELIAVTTAAFFFASAQGPLSCGDVGLAVECKVRCEVIQEAVKWDDLLCDGRDCWHEIGAKPAWIRRLGLCEDGTVRWEKTH